MDSITHIALGAITAEIMLGKKIGKKALVIGAVANSFPDIDFIAALWMNPADNVLAHRGFTHSILFMLLATWVFYWISLKWDKQNKVSHQLWFVFYLTQLTLHLLVDAFNAYGVGWFIPFNPIRISFHSIFVFDPFYSSLLIISFLLLLVQSKKSKYRIQVAIVGIVLSFMYLGYALTNKHLVNKVVKESLTEEKINYHRYFTTPTPLNSWLYFAVAEVDSGYYIGYRSVFDKKLSMPLKFVPRNEQLLSGWKESHTLHQLQKFSQGYYTVELQSDTLIFNDLRFGQITGWQSANARFSFHYYLNYPDENLLVMQRGRFANWNKETVKSLISRIRGNP